LVELREFSDIGTCGLAHKGQPFISLLTERPEFVSISCKGFKINLEEVVLWSLSTI
jgi:hypothetical protein